MGKKSEQKKKLLATWLFTVLVKKNIIECIFFSQYPEAGITLMCLLLHMKLRGDPIADSSLSKQDFISAESGMYLSP